MVVVHRPTQPHRCKIVPDVREVVMPLSVEDPPGTVRACTECGRTWVARRRPPQAGYAAGFDIVWLEEGRIARWWRARRRRRHS